MVALGPAKFEGHTREDHVIMVSFSSIKPDLYHDNACEVEPGEHSFINRKSYVYYREPRIYRVSEVQQRVRQGVWKVHQQLCCQSLLDRITSGFRESKMLPRTYNEYLDQLGI